MKVSIIGWYGTETMGDKAIFDGILYILSSIQSKIEMAIGSLFPFYSERTLLEEKKQFYETAPYIELSVFAIKDREEREKQIKNSDLLLVGGGPLMDIDEVVLLHRSFSYAKKNKIPTAIIGCGMGPLKDLSIIKLVKEILDFADLVTFRDSVAGEMAKNIDYKGEFYILGDPAVVSVNRFIEKKYERKKQNYIAVNFREYPLNAYGGKYEIELDEYKLLIKSLIKEYERVYLVPMHNFFVGGDDRLFLTKIGWRCQCKVLHNIFSLYDLYSLFYNANSCIGMRYHSVVFQTLLNGNNYIFDYTDLNNGKIKGFLMDYDHEGFYKKRVLNIQDGEHIDIQKIIDVLNLNYKYNYNMRDIKRDYVEKIESILR